MTLKKKRVCKTIKKRVCKTIENRISITIGKGACRTIKKPIRKTIKKRNSAFRAISGTIQPVPIVPLLQVQYEVEEFDLNNEYNPVTSTFRPRQSGVYSLFASVNFVSDDIVSPNLNFIELFITVNGSVKISDRESVIFRDNEIDASGIVRLQAGDEVQVFALISGVAGNIRRGVGSRFEGARIS